ncbi:PREDICTED: protein PET117 homolog, mitochondrial, partial [Gekko japonicus]|uniref:Protein PET117 homolog, mitochondrial n=1 Tax=Gekko japonicus TaxID=146911 RepID=A0ABM1LE89_GEKJA
KLREGVLRDIERQHRKEENLRLLKEEIALTKRLEMERDNMLMAKGPQQ